MRCKAHILGSNPKDKLVADIVVLDTGTVVECAVSELESSIERKRERF